MSNFSNRSIYPIYNSSHDDLTTLNIIWRFQIVWGQITFILGILGNLFVLYATIGHKAIKLDKMSIWIIENLAVADICNCLLVLLPTLVTQYGKLNHTVMFGVSFYTAMGCYMYTFFVANLFLVNVLSVNKLMRCMFPLRNLDSTRRQRIIVTIATILISIIPTIWTVYGILDGFIASRESWRDRDYIGAVNVARVTGKFPSTKLGKIKRIVNYFVVGICNGLPGVTLVILNVALVTFAMKKTNSAINKKNFLIVALVTYAFLLSFIPYFVEQLNIFRHLGYAEMSYSLAYLSTWINPVIYFAVNPPFRNFTMKKLTVHNSVNEVHSGSQSQQRITTHAAP